MFRSFLGAASRVARAAEGKAGDGSIPDKLSFSLLLPHTAVMERASVDMVAVPALGGMFGVLPGHVPSVAELQPGVVSVHHSRDNEVTDYFISGGFSIVHSDSRHDVVAVEAVPIDELDADVVRNGLREAENQVNSASSELAKTQAEISLEVYKAMAVSLNIPV